MPSFAEISAAPRVKVECPDWIRRCKTYLGNAEMLPGVVDQCIEAGVFGLDTESTGLDTRVFMGITQDQIVGFSVAPADDVAYYFPLAHKEGAHLNIPIAVFVREFGRLCRAMRERRTRALLFNAPVDQEFISYSEAATSKLPGAEDLDPWDDLAGWEDAHILVKLYDLNRKETALKTVAHEDLGMEVIELDQLFSDEEKASPSFKKDFSQVDPGQDSTVWYTCQDALLHRLLFLRYHDRVVTNPRYEVQDPQTRKVSKVLPRPSQALIYQVEKSSVLATRWMQRNRVGIDVKKAGELIELGQREWIATAKTLYETVDSVLGRDATPNVYKYLFANPRTNPREKIVDILRSGSVLADMKFPKDPAAPVLRGDHSFPAVYDVNSPQQLGRLLVELGIPDLRFTEGSGQVGTSDDDIEEIAKRHGEKFPTIKLIGRLREIAKALSTWLIPLYNGAAEDGSGAFGWKQIGTETGRYSSPKPKKPRPGWPATAFQTLPTDKGDRPECMRRVREVICGRNGRLIVSIDYSGVELRIVTSLSGEPKWVTAFFICSDCKQEFSQGDGEATPECPPPRCPRCGSDKIGDIHTGTAIEVLGANPEDLDWKEKRGRGKVLNFALLYGGGGDAASNAIECDLNEGWRVKRRFDGNFPVLKRYWDQQHEYARKHKYVVSPFGRVLPLLNIDSSQRFIVSEAERNSVNGPIQAGSADITKIAMALIYREIKRRGWLDKVLLVATVHDELVFEMDPSVIEEAIEVIVPIMCRNPLLLKLNWPIPLTSDIEVGKNWSVPWNLLAMRAGEVRYLGDKKVKKPEDAAALGVKWDELPSFPETLLPHFKKRDLGYVIERRSAATGRSTVQAWVALDAGSDLTEEVAEKVAQAAARCRGTGPVPLRLRAGGEWQASWCGEEILTDPAAVRKEAEALGLKWLVPS